MLRVLFSLRSLLDSGSGLRGWLELGHWGAGRAACGSVEASLFVVWLGVGGRFLYDMGGSRVWNINGTSKRQSCELAARLLLRPQNSIK